MSEQGQRGGFAGGGMAYVGAVLTRYGRLQIALKSFRQQTEWLWAYLDVALFIVARHFAGVDRGEYREQEVLSLFDRVPDYAHDAGHVLREVEQLAADLRLALAAEETGGQGAAHAFSMAEVSPATDEGREGSYRRGYLRGWLYGASAMLELLRRGQGAVDAFHTCAEFGRGELSEWRYGDCTRQEMPPTSVGKAEGAD